MSEPEKKGKSADLDLTAAPKVKTTLIWFLKKSVWLSLDLPGQK